MNVFNRRKRQDESHSSGIRSGDRNDVEMANSPRSKERSNISGREEVNHNGHKVTKGIQPEGESGRSGIHPLKFLKICFRSASPASAVVNILWPVVPSMLLM